MKKLLLLLVIIIITFSCSSVKKTEKALNTGNYDQAINIALSKLRTNKNKKGKQPYILMLEQAYDKAIDRDKNAVIFLEKEENPANLERIYNTYLSLKKRQERIKPLLPLYVVEESRTANFSIDNYDQKIINTKEKLSRYLYNNAKSLLSSARKKLEYRNIYEDLIYLDKITPNYKNTREMIEEAHEKGTDFIKVTMQNNTNVIIPKRLESDLLNFSTYGLDDLWTVYHSRPQRSILYNYAMIVDLREINISPEQIKEKQLKKERLVKDGWEYLLDENDEIVIDDKGKKVKVDKLIKVQCEYYEFTQFKAANVVGNVQYKNLETKQLLDAFPIVSEHVFQHTYANYNGDKRALEDPLLGYLGLKSVQFPSNEQMVYDSGEDLKNKIKKIITTYRFK
ncbi:hypothetical protein [Aquimarina muelleri]|uniref:Lipoprotein n=1 Tax=Aquimarina muelleri TaxID=279356 RepID=A0A918JXQ7_9FLAO|nr:hypothetical protein [Aquimarina muelleri]MCX2763422.1 hypothetical protein [Aquimarina muelleri]GGX29008.1 hypothetical protein GCM10007384_32750 [Aquimarina muelleri]